METRITKKNDTVNMTVKLEPELKESLRLLAIKKGMDLSKLSRAVLTNFVAPGTFSL